MTAHALRTTTDTPAPAEKPTPLSVRLMRNVDFVFFPLALIIFLAAGITLVGWLTGVAAWAVQRGIDELARYKAERAEDVRTRVGLLAGSMILRGWVVAGIIVAVGLGNSDAGLAAAVLFLAVFTLQLTMTMAIRPFDTPAPGPSTAARGGTAKR